MNEFFAALIGASAVVVVPLVAWLTQRFTQEGRLLIRIDRYGRAFALMPESSERDEFESHLLRSISELNRWLDPSNRRIRLLQRLITWGLGVAMTVILAVVLGVLHIHDPALTFPIGLAAGAVVAMISIISGTLLEKSATRKSSANIAMVEGPS